VRRPDAAQDEETNMTRKSKTVFRHLMLCSAAFVLATGFAAVPARAQDTTAATQAQPQYQAPSDQQLSQGQLDQLVAPIALYPDPLLTQVLMASTYPLEVVEAARWSHDNPGVTGNALQDAMQAQSWDPSVKALTAVPQTLQMMSDKLDWTQQLGDAFLAQQQDVMNAVQSLRTQAQAAGNLQSTAQQRVTTAPAPQGAASTSMQQAIVIEPTNPDVYYVPVYNPAVAYGNWDYPAYPPFYWSPAGFVASNVVSFAAGVAVGAAIWGGCDWWGHNVIINVNRFNAFNHTNIANNIWVHNPAHRDGVPYRNAAVASRFDRADTIANRDALRDRLDAVRPGMSRTWDGAANAARTVDPERPMPDVGRDAGRIPDVARDAERQPDRVTMPSREFDRPMADSLAQDLRERAPDFHMPERSFGGEGGGFLSHFGGGRRRF
jgi:Protein of unknown function (DUF3300)